jgi:hypothetical protein
MVDPADGRKIAKIAELLFVVIRVLNTGKKIRLKLYKHVCHMIGMQVIANFPWARMNETMHSVSSDFPQRRLPGDPIPLYYYGVCDIEQY